jgi:microcystin-dependent protein
MFGFPWLLGEVLLLPYTFTPLDFDRCDGQLVPIGDGDLFKLLGTQFGGDGTKDFGLPDLKEREPLAGLTYYITTKGAPPS